jgi:soluble lytic murein transglycosylase-like protein
MAASPMRAADPVGPDPAVRTPSAARTNVPAVQTTYVVRADPRTGRLVRSAIVRDATLPNFPNSSSVSSSSKQSAKPENKPTKEISDIVAQASRTHQVDPLLVHSIIKVESNYNSFAISNKGAEGLMQLMPPTARMLGVSNSFDPQQNIEAGVKYLKYLQGVFKDDRLALAAYNAGPAAVDKYKQVPPFKETQNYVDLVGKRYENAKRDENANRAALPGKDATNEKDAASKEAKSLSPAVDAALSEPTPESTIVEKHPKLEQFVDEHGRLSLRTIE